METRENHKIYSTLIVILLVQDRLYTSESDVYRRQILTYKDDPRTVRIKTLLVLKGLAQAKIIKKSVIYFGFLI